MKAKRIKSLKSLFNQEFLTDLLCTAMYDSSWFTCSVHKDTKYEVYKDANEKNMCIEDVWAYVLLNGGYINVCDEEEGEEHRLALKDIIKGFENVMYNYPTMYANIRNEDYDLYDADAVIQCAIFGEIVYG